jgi:hypothetical protein
MKNQNELANVFILNEKWSSKNPLTAEMTANDVILISDKEKTFEFEFHFDPDKDDLNRVTIVHKEIPYEADIETLVDANGVVKCLIHPLYERNGEVFCDSDALELSI